MEEVIGIVVKQTGVNEKAVKQTIALLDDGNTVPFIARYRKEATGGLTEEEIRNIAETTEYQRNLLERKEEVYRLIKEQGKMTDKLEHSIYASTKLNNLRIFIALIDPKRIQELRKQRIWV